MPRILTCNDRYAASLAECTDALDASGFDPRDAASLQHAADWLHRLGNNSTFLGDLLIDELAARHREDVLENGYGPQVIMLRPPGGDYFIRANIWPSRDEHLVRASGGGPFAYGMPHDHNFDFLTHGYFGPGYWSDYYTYDYAEVTGWRGEEVPSLRFVERARLEPGRLMHYRAHQDVHAQIAPDALSVSLNVMHCGAAQGWLDQYRFDLEGQRIAGILGAGASDAFLRIAVASGQGEALDLAETFARRHPSERMRLSAVTALAAISSDPAAVWRQAEKGGSRLVAMEARSRREALEA